MHPLFRGILYSLGIGAAVMAGYLASCLASTKFSLLQLGLSAVIGVICGAIAAVRKYGRKNAARQY